MTDTTPHQMRTIQQHIRSLLVTMFVAAAVIIAVLAFVLISVSTQASNVLARATTAADFNQEFKTNLDLEMYYQAIRPYSEASLQELPMAEVDNAEKVLKRLATETTLPENRERVRRMLVMCANLRKYMTEIAETKSPDLRMKLLDQHISGKTGLTRLIVDDMHNFISDEVHELARLRSTISHQIPVLLGLTAAVVVLLFVLLLMYSLRVSRRISVPMQTLSRKAEQFGSNDFAGSPVDTDIVELKILDRNFDKMAGRITSLMDRQRRDQQSLHRAELELLQAQINPHFLYNTLDSIAILAESQREDDVIDMVNSLSTFFRNSLNRGEDIISLRSELIQARSYLEIQQIRYSDILTWQIDVPEDIQDCNVPKLILQPLIENALYHGIKNRRGRGLLTITGEADGEDLLLRVKDNGAGMTPEQLALLQSGAFEEHHSGLGLKNVHQRIRLYCGKEYGLSFDSVLGEGTTVTVRLPRRGVTAIRKEEDSHDR